MKAVCVTCSEKCLLKRDITTKCNKVWAFVSQLQSPNMTRYCIAPYQPFQSARNIILCDPQDLDVPGFKGLNLFWLFHIIISSVYHIFQSYIFHVLYKLFLLSQSFCNLWKMINIKVVTYLKRDLKISKFIQFQIYEFGALLSESMNSFKYIL